MRKKPASKNPRTNPIKKDQKDPNKILKGRLKMIIPIILTSLISILIAYYFFKRSASKKDADSISKGVNKIEQSVSQLRQDILNTNDYKKYLDIYQLLYKSIMKLPAASSGVSKYQPHKTNLAASCGELTPKEIR